MATLVEDPAVPGSGPVNGTAPPGQAPSLSQQSTALGEANPSASSFHINGETAPHSLAGLSQSSWDLQDQAFSFQGQAHNSTWNHSARLFLPLDPLTWLPLSLGTPTLGHHAALKQQ